LKCCKSLRFRCIDKRIGNFNKGVDMFKKRLLGVLFASCLIAGVMQGESTSRGFFDVVGAVADAIYEHQYDSAVYDVDGLWRQTNNECIYFSAQFPYFYQYQLADIAGIFRLISYEWMPFVNEFERYHGLSLDQVTYLADCLRDLNYALSRVVIRPIYYDAELAIIMQTLRGLWYEIERPATNPYAIVHCAQWVNDITHIVIHM
jgi:hypothetical protein